MKRIIESIEKHTGGQHLALECLHTTDAQNSIAQGSMSVGDEIDCLQCDSLSFPEGISAYKKTPVFNQDTIPKGFRRAHSTKKGVWALITVLSGKVRYVVDYLDNKSMDLDQHSKGVISPQMEHHLEVIGNVELYVEFYAK